MIKETNYCLRVLLPIAFLLAIGFSISANGQAYVEVFGQNRIQYRKFDWKYFDTKHFRVYHYDRAGRQLGRYVAEEAENNISVIEKKLGGQFPKRFNIVLYNSYEEYRQTNIGLKDESQLTENTRAGTVDLVGDKLVVYFTGQHADLRHQIKTGMARIVMERMIFGDNFKKMVKNALLLNLPQWVTDGYIAYLVDGWDARTNSDWKSLLDARPGAGFYDLSEQYPELAGKAFWKFVSDQFSMATVKNLLYSMQMKTSLNKAMKDKGNLGMKVTKAYDSCINYYKNVYARDARRQEKPDSANGLIALKVPKDNSIIRSIRVSPRGSDVAYVAWKDGKYSVLLQKTAHGQEVSTLLEGGQKDLTEQTDPTYPLLAWSNTGYKMGILYKKGSQTHLRIYNSLQGRIQDNVIPDNRFERVLGFAFTEDDDKLVFSAIRKSQTDLYMFTIKGSKLTNITDDVWDDISPEFVSGGSRTGILFLSNRPKPNLNVPLGVNELPTGPMNVFFFNTKSMRPELLQCTDVKTGHISQPVQYGLDNFAYLYDGNGINNKYVVMFKRDRQNHDSAYSVPITNYSSNILSQQYNLASGDVADVVQEGDKYRVYFHELQMPGENTPVKKLVPTTLSVEKPEPKTSLRQVLPLPGQAAATSVQKEDEPEESTTIKGGSAFQSEFSDTATYVRRKKTKANNIHKGTLDKTDSFTLAEINDSAYVKMKPAPYRLSFKPDFFSIRQDNSILFSQYQPTNAGLYQTPSLGGLVMISMNELMENHRITAGFQIPVQIVGTSLQVTGSTYFLQYQNFTRRLDWGLMFLQMQNKLPLEVAYADTTGGTTKISASPQLFKSVTNMLQADFGYPLDRVRSLRFHTGIRQDKLVEKVTDYNSLFAQVPNQVAYTSLSRLEYVFDNTISPAMNIRNGSRFKVYGEELYGLDHGNKSCFNIGTDIRNYQKLYKNIILANRLAYAHSDGTGEVQYIMGGVDNWILPQQDINSLQPQGTYAFQTMATPLRGYKQYARVGNNFAVLNTEVRMPVLTPFIKRPIQSAFLKNLQVVGFVDAGDAWKGFLPDAQTENSKFTYPTLTNMPQPPSLNNVNLTVTVPGSGGLAVGYGAGLRSSLFGYFVRVDAAWNIEPIKKPIIYVSLGSDF